MSGVPYQVNRQILANTDAIAVNAAAIANLNPDPLALTIKSSNYFAIKLGNDIDGEANAQLGYSVALSADGKILAVGAPISQPNNIMGYVEVYEYKNLQWELLGTHIQGEASDDQFGGSVALSSDGKILAVGASGNDANGSNSGHVRVYQIVGSGGNTTFPRLGTDIDGEALGDNSGGSIALSSDGKILAIGAHQNDGNGNIDSGHVRVYKWNEPVYIAEGNYTPGYWSQMGTDIDGEAAGDKSGGSVALSSDGTIVAIGAHNNGGDNSGHVRVYKFEILNTNVGVVETWTQLGSDIGDNLIAQDLFGYDRGISLSSDGTILAVAVSGRDVVTTGDNRGQANVYKYNGTYWTRIGALDLSNELVGERDDDAFGYSVDLSADGTILAVGTQSGGSQNHGYIKLFKYNGTTWTERVEISGEYSNDYAGQSVALSSDGTIVAFGARYNDDGGTPNSGSVRVYSVTDTQTNVTVNGTLDAYIINAHTMNLVHLPTSDPLASGRLWNSNGYLKISP